MSCSRLNKPITDFETRIVETFKEELVVTIEWLVDLLMMGGDQEYRLTFR